MKKGFTLAEVLITLGIIGVVAAMTMPVIISNYKKQEIKTGFKKAYSAISQAYNLAFYDLGFPTNCHYGSFGEGHQGSECPLLKEAFEKRLRPIKICRGHIFTDGCVPEYTDQQSLGLTGVCSGMYRSSLENNSTSYVLPDGIILFLYGSNIPANIMGSPANFYVDVNGKKGPNKWGHDVFGFRLSNSNTEIPKIVPDNNCILTEEGAYDLTKDIIN